MCTWWLREGKKLQSSLLYKHASSISSTDENDFDTTAFNVIFPADEDEESPITIVNAPVPIVDDATDEAEEQSFMILLEVLNATDIDALTIDRSVATGIIQDDDSESCVVQCNHFEGSLSLAVVRIGFSQKIYSFMEPPFITLIFDVSLIKDDNHTSEETFRVGIITSDVPGITPATHFSEQMSGTIRSVQLGRHSLKEISRLICRRYHWLSN